MEDTEFKKISEGSKEIGVNVHSKDEWRNVI